MRTGGAALAMRSASLGVRMLLPLYIVRTLGLEAAGLYGLATAVIGFAPAALGWGLNYFLVRDLAREERAADRLVASRLAVTLASLFAATLIALPLFWWVNIMPGRILIAVFLLVWLEAIALDLHMALLAMSRSTFANALLLMRSTIWAPPFILASALSPSLQSLDALFFAWILGHGCAWIALVQEFRRHRPTMSWRLAIDRTWIRTRLAQAPIIYVSDLGLAGSLYADRVIVSALLGMEATGVYAVLAAFANALQTLAGATIIQPAMPELIRSAHDRNLLTPLLKDRALSLIVAMTLLGGGLWLLIDVWASRLNASLAAERLLLVLLILAAIVRSLGDLINCALSGMERDGAVAGANISTAVMGLILACLLIPPLGLQGMGLAAAAAAMAGLVLRWRRTLY